MGWSSDWLYKLLLNLARDTFAEALHAAHKRSEKSPIKLLAAEHTDYHQGSNMTCGVPARVWSSDDDFASLVNATQCPPTDQASADPGAIVYRVPIFSWTILPDRKQVLICRWIGPRYASGAWWDVRGQGTTGRLVLAERTRWVS